MAYKTNYLEEKISKLLFGGTAYSVPAAYYCGLWTEALTETSEVAADASGEVSGASYARAPIQNDSTSWDGSGGARSNAVEIAFPTAGGNWGVVTHLGICDGTGALSKVLYWAELTSPKTIQNGDTVRFAIGDLSIQED